jgi:hypothetical protein
MRNIRTTRQELETLDYMGDLVAELTTMATRDNHRLLSYILYSASIEIDELKRLRGAQSPASHTPDNGAGLGLPE